MVGKWAGKMFKREQAFNLKTALCVLVAGAVALSIAPKSAQAAKLSGAISFNGNVTAYLNSNGTGTEATDLITAHSLVFGPSVVSAGANGSYSGITSGTAVTMYSPLDINPPALPVPATSPLWQVTEGPVTYSFTLSALIEPYVSSTALVLSGSGVMSDGTPGDANTGTWIGTFTTSGSTYSWNASSAAAVPEPASIALIVAGAGLLCRPSRARRLAR